MSRKGSVRLHRDVGLDEVRVRVRDGYSTLDRREN